MTPFFYRTGTPVAERELSNVHLGSRGNSGHLTRLENCSRCGGQGGSQAWAYTGWTCYQCNGRRQLPQTHRVFTAKYLAELNAIAETKRLKAVAKRENERQIKRQAFIAWAKPHGPAIGRILTAKRNNFIQDLASKLRTYYQLTDKQLSAATKVLDMREKVKVQSARSEWVGDIKERITFEAEVMFIKGIESRFGLIDLIKFRDIDDNLFTWFASGEHDCRKGDQVIVTGTVKKHEEYLGVKQTTITRCKIEKLTIVTPDEVGDIDIGSEMFHLVYPEKRMVSAETLLSWHADKAADGEVEWTDDITKAIYDLEDIGFITVGR